jgi:hypothetical protein
MHILTKCTFQGEKYLKLISGFKGLTDIIQRYNFYRDYKHRILCEFSYVGASDAWAQTSCPV